jgi:hypothetical protein
MVRIIWALFGNDEYGIYGDLNWNPEQEQTVMRAIRWWFRNPMHNLMFHVLSVPKPFTSEGDYPNDVFSPVVGWNNVIRIGSNGKRYRFISYIGAVKFYIGWRERGNFGLKLTSNTPQR